jgi:hypothetical protein
MGERLADAGDWSASFVTAHHPLYGILVGAALVIGRMLEPIVGNPFGDDVLESMRAGQFVAATCGALAILPLFALARSWFGSRAAHVTAALYAFGLWTARHPAACAAEGPLYLFLACGLLAADRRRFVWAGVATGLAYATKPEGAGLLLVLGAWVLAQRPWSQSLRAFAALILSFAATAFWVPFGFAAHGTGFVASPKLGFVLADGIAAQGVDPIAHYATQLVRILGASFEGVGYLVLPLALYGAWSMLRQAPRAGRRAPGEHRGMAPTSTEVRSAPDRARPPSPGPLLGANDLASRPVLVPIAAFVLLLLVIPVLRSHHRFVSAYGALLLPFAGVALVALVDRTRRRSGRSRRSSALLAAATVLVLSPDLVRLPQPVNERRAPIARLGAVLRGELAQGGHLATELARLELFAGERPGPPRRIEREEILARLDDPEADVRVCVVVAPRTGITAEDLLPRGFAPLPLPAGLAGEIEELHVLVYARPRRRR